jgi:hypothetical protein
MRETWKKLRGKWGLIALRPSDKGLPRTEGSAVLGRIQLANLGLHDGILE